MYANSEIAKNRSELVVRNLESSTEINSQGLVKTFIVRQTLNILYYWHIYKLT